MNQLCNRATLSPSREECININIPTKHIGLFGGSFDPPHLGHQALVKAAFKTFNLDEIWIVPVGLPVHRQLSGQATPKQRLSWLTTMFAADLNVHVLNWELNNPKPSPTIDTLLRFTAENPTITPLWLMGMDSFLDMPNWIKYPKHQRLCNVAVFTRKGSEKLVETNPWQRVEAQNIPQRAGHICLLDVDLPDISATQIRQKAQAHTQDLHQDTCNAIVSCYTSG